MRLLARFFINSGGVAVEKAKRLTFHQRKRIYDRDGGVCQLCGHSVALFKGGVRVSAIKSAAIDHILARSRGGQNTNDNLRLLCLSCNSSKGAK